MQTDHPVQRDKKAWGMLIATFALGVIVALAGFTLTSANPDSDIVVFVNGQAITKDAFYDRLEEEAGMEVLDQLIAELLLEQAGQARGITITDEEIENELAQIKASYPDDETFLQELGRFGLTLERLNHQLLLHLIVDKLGREGVEVTDEEVSEFFEANKENLSRPAAVLAAHILVTTKEEADEIIQQLEAGGDFAEVAKEKSIDTASAMYGGSLGYIQPDSPITQPFIDAAFALESGETSEPVQTEFGWHIIRVHDRSEAQEATLEDTADEIREWLIQQKARSVGEIVEDLLHDANIDVQWSRYTMFSTDVE